MPERPTTRFESHYALADLPYFDVRDGRIVLTDPELGPMIDVHTHLALSYGRRQTVDLHRQHPHTEHYLPVDCPLDLDVYMNRNFRPPDLQRMKRDLLWRSFTTSGMRVTHTIPNLAREMADLGVVVSVLLPSTTRFCPGTPSAISRHVRRTTS
jgi:hypothetical protein